MATQGFYPVPLYDSNSLGCFFVFGFFRGELFLYSFSDCYSTIYPLGFEGPGLKKEKGVDWSTTQAPSVQLRIHWSRRKAQRGVGRGSLSPQNTLSSEPILICLRTQVNSTDNLDQAN